jgi:glycosyltransferase involved in cell wall biosynthesis
MPLTFTIVTPCRNARALVGRTVDSIVGQRAVRSGRVALEYLVRDGASADGTVEEVTRRSGGLARVVSQPDRGMYDALAGGLAEASGDVVAYLNAGDVYHPSALDVMADAFEDGAVTWATGMAVVLEPSGKVRRVRPPFRYLPRLIRRGLYGGGTLPFIQQESTFFRRELLRAVDLERLRSFRLAGDYFLWKSLASVARLRVVEAAVGAFQVHAGQLSEDLAAYRSELRAAADPAAPWDHLLALVEAAAWHAPAPVRRALAWPPHLASPSAVRRWE